MVYGLEHSLVHGFKNKKFLLININQNDSLLPNTRVNIDKYDKSPLRI